MELVMFLSFRQWMPFVFPSNMAKGISKRGMLHMTLVFWSCFPNP